MLPHLTIDQSPPIQKSLYLFKNQFIIVGGPFLHPPNIESSSPNMGPNSCTFHVHSCCWKHTCRYKVLSTTKKGQPLFWIWLVVSTCFNTFQLVAMSTMCIPKKICSSWRSPKLTRNWLWFSSFLGDPRTRPLAYELGCPLAVTVFPTCFFWCGRLPCCCLSSAGSAAPPRSQQWPGDRTHIQTYKQISTFPQKLEHTTSTSKPSLDSGSKSCACSAARADWRIRSCNSPSHTS